MSETTNIPFFNPQLLLARAITATPRLTDEEWDIMDQPPEFWTEELAKKMFDNQGYQRPPELVGLQK